MRPDLFARVNRSIIEHDERRSLHSPAEIVEAIDQGGAVYGSLEDIRLECAVQVEKSEYIQSGGMLAWDFQSLTALLPGVRYARRQSESGGIKIDKLEITI